MPFSLLFAAILLLSPVHAQQEKDRSLINNRKAGFVMEYGLPFWELPEGVYYHPIEFKGSFELPFWQSYGFFNMSVEMCPTIGFSATRGDHVYEFGLGFRFKWNFLVSEHDLFSALASFGPHWTSIETARVARGFLFQGNWMGVYERRFDLIKSYMTVVLGAGFRHISNAGLKKPNLGIDNVLFSAAVRFPLNY